MMVHEQLSLPHITVFHPESAGD